MIRLNSALWAACSFMTLSSTPSILLSSAELFNMRFCNCSIFDSVLSRKGAEKATLSAVPPLSRISSFRGRLFSSTSGCCCACGFCLKGFLLATSLARKAICNLPLDKRDALCHFSYSVRDPVCHDGVCRSRSTITSIFSTCYRSSFVLDRCGFRLCLSCGVTGCSRCLTSGGLLYWRSWRCWLPRDTIELWRACCFGRHR